MLTLSEIPLTESILQKCYKSKTYVRNGQFDLYWHLKGKNNVTIGEKSGKFYLLPPDNNKVLVDMLPQGMIQVPYLPDLHVPKSLNSLSDLMQAFPELSDMIKKHKIIFGSKK